LNLKLLDVGMNGVQDMSGGMVMKERFVYELEVGSGRAEVRGRFGDERGFLLLEHLIAIAIMSMLSIAFLALMQIVSVYTIDQTSLTMHEVNSLAMRLQSEIQHAERLTATDGRLLAHFTRDGEVVSFTAQNNRLVRQVNGQGGEIMVYHLSGMNVVLFDSQSARVSLMSLEGDVFQFYLQLLHVEVNLLASWEEDEDEEE